jgi:2-polyprenyl-6-methoxyphenol hydroxylase-like FAD-dependent oxidoreductase
MAAPTILISGLGIAGPTLAYWLAQYGFEPTLVERSPTFRESGYMIDFWGPGYDVAERMGMLPEIKQYGYRIEEVRFVNGRGKRVGGFGGAVLRDTLYDRFISIPRGELARLLYQRIADNLEIIFNDSVVAIEQGATDVGVSFAHSGPRRFDLVIGGGGLHSPIRNLVFRPERRFEHYLGFIAAAFIADGYPSRDQGAYVSYGVPGRQVARYSLRDGQTGFLFVVGEKDPQAADRAIHAGPNFLAHAFRNAGWECNEIIAALAKCEDVYLDKVSQIRMDSWSEGRVVLVGDAAYCPSLLAGEGASLAMAGAYVLAGELKRAEGDHASAFRSYQSFLKPFIERRQRSASRLGGWFAPASHLGILARNAATELMNVPVIGRWLFRRTIADEIALPSYA